MQHAINALLDKQYSKQAKLHHMATSQLTPKQNQKIKSSIIDINHHLNQVLPAFDNLNKELSPGFHLVDTFSDHFSFNIVKCKDAKARIAHFNKLKNVYRASKNNPNILFIITDASVKNNIAMSVTHIWKEQALITKATYHTMNISPTEAELFAIRCRISQAVHINDITNIVVVTDAISAAQKIFNISCHLFQLHSIAISQNLRVFFSKNPRNSITFWDCPSDDKWPPHQLVDKESKTSKFHPILPSKTSWDYSRKKELL